MRIIGRGTAHAKTRKLKEKSAFGGLCLVQ